MRAKAVIIGGGVIGLSLAYHLGKMGFRDLVVVEKDHLNRGASGRCAGGVRHQWTNPATIELMKRSIFLFERLAGECGMNVWFRQGGYLFLAMSRDQERQLEDSVRVQNEHGVATRMMGRREISSLCPDLNMEGIQAGSYNPKDGALFPFSVVWAYAKGARGQGCTIMTQNKVTGIESKNGRILAVLTGQGPIETSLVINAAGTWAPSIGKMLGVDLPNRREKHQALVTESLRPFLGPNLVPMDSGLFLSQTMRGEIFACLGVDKDAVENQDPTFAFLRKAAERMGALIPRLASVKVLRCWGGFYDITPDTNPILGPVEGVEGFMQCHGFMGHGFMMAPVIGEILADFLVRGKTHPMIEACRPERFRSHGLKRESMIIG